MKHQVTFQENFSPKVLRNYSEQQTSRKSINDVFTAQQLQTKLAEVNAKMQFEEKKHRQMKSCNKSLEESSLDEGESFRNLHADFRWCFLKDFMCCLRFKFLGFICNENVMRATMKRV